MSQDIELVESEEVVHGGSSVANLSDGVPAPVRLRSLAICGPINEETSISVIQALLTMEAEDPATPIVMYINTPGGTVYDAFAIYDVMKSMKCSIITVGFGRVMSAGVLIISAGKLGSRYAMPNSYFMTHDLQCGISGSFSDVNSQHKHLSELKEKYCKLLATNSSLTTKQIKTKLTGIETYFSSHQAKKLGIIDHISVIKPAALVGRHM
jgi:ATP-dependent Clp protease protease subunit